MSYEVREIQIPTFSSNNTCEMQLPAEVITVFRNEDGINCVRCIYNSSDEEPLMRRFLTRVENNQEMYTLPGYYIGTLDDKHYFLKGMEYEKNQPVTSRKNIGSQGGS